MGPVALVGVAWGTRQACHLSQPLGKSLGALLTAVILGMREKGVMQKTAQLRRNEQLQEGNQSLFASKTHS